MVTKSGTPVRRGRPPQTADEQERVRAQIVAATGQVFAQHGYHGVTVARILNRAGISRPTFYRYYRNADEPLRALIDEVGWSAVRRVRAAVAATHGDLPKVVAACDAYLEWSRAHRALLRPMHAALHDRNSSVSRLRRDALGEIASVLELQLAASGRPKLPRLTLEILVNTVEYTCYRLHTDTPADETAVTLARTLMVRTAVALLGGPDDWRLLLDHPTYWKHHLT